jgi:FkbM family methyltransferase
MVSLKGSRILDISPLKRVPIFGKIVRILTKKILGNATLPILQGKLKGKKWIVGSGCLSYWLGIYEIKMSKLIENTIKGGDTVFDIGAHVGYYSLLFSILTGDIGKVYSFEPLPLNVHFLRKHIISNDIINVKIVQAALTNKDDFARFEEGHYADVSHLSDDGELTVKTIRLDGFVIRENISRVDFLKIDVEGAEGLVLQGAQETLTNFHPRILLSTHGQKVHQECCQLLKSLGYRLIPLDRREVSEASEIFASISI